MADYTEIVENGVTWRVADRYLEKVKNVVIPVSRGQTDDLPCTVIKENMVRTVLSVGHLVIKTYRIRGVAESMKYFVIPSKAETEWEMSRVLAKAGLDSVEAVAFGERKRGGLLDEAYFACIHLGDVKTLAERLDGAEPDKRKRLAEAAAELVHALHAAGVYHRDLHAGNVLVTSAGKLHVIDLHRVSKRIGTSGRYANLAKLFGPSGTCFDEEEARRGVDHYCKLVGSNNVRRVFLRVAALAEKIHKRHLKSRSVRCIKESSRFTIDRRPGFRIYRKRSLSAEDVQRIVNMHRAGEVVAPRVHDSSSSFATRVECLWKEDSPAVFVKEEKSRGAFRAILSCFTGSRTRRAWLAANALEVNRVPTPEPLAFVESALSGAGSLLITDFIENASTLKEVARAQPLSETRAAVVSAVAPIASALHRADVYHSDWSAKNFLLVPAPGSEGDNGPFLAYLVDTEAVRPHRRLGLVRIVKNLGQLNDVPTFTRAERMRFYHLYRADGGGSLSHEELRAVAAYTGRRIQKRMRKEARKSGASKRKVPGE